MIQEVISGFFRAFFTVSIPLFLAWTKILSYYYEQENGAFVRSREKVIGNTVYTVISREKSNADATAFDITKRLIERIVKDMSRFGRDHILVGYYTKYYLAEADVRFIAIYDQVDSVTNPDDDITPFKNILNEMYAKDCSKKIKAVVRAKGNSGKHITTIPPLGYMKNPEDIEKWIIDEKGAEIVREIFKLCIQGYGPTQIARITWNTQAVP